MHTHTHIHTLSFTCLLSYLYYSTFPSALYYNLYITVFLFNENLGFIKTSYISVCEWCWRNSALHTGDERSLSQSSLLVSYLQQQSFFSIWRRKLSGVWNCARALEYKRTEEEYFFNFSAPPSLSLSSSLSLYSSLSLSPLFSSSSLSFALPLSPSSVSLSSIPFPLSLSLSLCV